ncbi:hypothetical protein D4R78_08555 [bacterium]|nr:MAG: hypothetical protein D4R78_08555 [bacterium]
MYNQNREKIMLKILRNKKTAKKVWIGLAVIIIPAFALWGFGGGLRSREDTAPVGKIFGRNISYIEFKDALAAVKTMAIMRFGDRLDEVQKYLNLEAQAWERLVLLAEAKKRHIAASDREIIEDIENSSFFQYQGAFSNKLYNEALRYSLRIQPRIFEELIRQNIIIAKLYEQVTAKVSLSDEQIKKEYAKVNQEMSIDYVASLFSDFSKDISPSEKQINDYYAGNKPMFKQPVTVNLIYTTADSEEKAKKVVALLKKNNALKLAAQETGLETKETGPFSSTDSIPGLGFSPELLNLISKLKKGAFTPIIKSDNSFYVFQLKEKTEMRIPELTEIEDKVKQAFIREAAQKLAAEKIKQCQNELTREDLIAAGNKLKLRTAATGLFKYEASIAGLGQAAIFWNASYGLKENQASQIISTPLGYYIIKIKSATLLDQARFAKEKADFAKKILFEKKQELFNNFIEELKKKA